MLTDSEAHQAEEMAWIAARSAALTGPKGTADARAGIRTTRPAAAAASPRPRERPVSQLAVARVWMRGEDQAVVAKKAGAGLM